MNMNHEYGKKTSILCHRAHLAADFVARLQLSMNFSIATAKRNRRYSRSEQAGAPAFPLSSIATTPKLAEWLRSQVAGY